MAFKKLSPRRLADLSGSRRKKPPVREQNRALKALVESEHELVQTLLKDRETRIQMTQVEGWPLDGLSVWKDFGHTWDFTEGDPRRLGPWSHLSEYMKLQLGFMVALSFGGYSFTSRVHPALTSRWAAGGRLQARVQERIKESFAQAGIPHLEYAYVLEARTKSGKSRTDVHLHGYLTTSDPYGITRFKVAVETALHRARGHRPLGHKAWDEDPVYDFDSGDGRGYGRWVSYIAKNVSRYDQRIRGRRIFMSRPALQSAREFWEFHRDEV